jgi:hypothetical protein
MISGFRIALFADKVPYILTKCPLWLRKVRRALNNGAGDGTSHDRDYGADERPQDLGRSLRINRDVLCRDIGHFLSR